MKQTFIPLDDIQNYVDSRLWDICTATILDQTKHEDLIAPIINHINLWAPKIDELTSVIEYHGLSGLIYSLSKNHDIKFSYTASMVVKVSTAKHLQRWEAISEALKLINNEAAKGICFCLLKGSSLATEIYRESYHRAMSDIDIMCSPNKAKIFYKQCLEAGFSEVADSTYSSRHHHLSALNKKIGQHNIFLEIHTHALSHDLREQLYWQDINKRFRRIDIDGVSYLSIHHEAMLLQLCVHAISRDQVIKLSNIVDIFRYSIIFENQINWEEIEYNYPQVIITMRYMRMLLKLPAEVLPKIKIIEPRFAKKMSGLGQGMMPLREAYNKNISLLKRLKLLFFPSPWWQHIFYAIESDDSKTSGKRIFNKSSFVIVRYIIHPIKLITWIFSKYTEHELTSLQALKRKK